MYERVGIIRYVVATFFSVGIGVWLVFEDWGTDRMENENERKKIEYDIKKCARSAHETTSYLIDYFVKISAYW